MRPLFLTAFLTLLVLTSVAAQSKETGSPCDSSDAVCRDYLPIWRELVLKKSQIDAAYFDGHVKLLEARSNPWNDGVSLRVRYRLSLDWVVMEHEDQIITYVAPDAAPYPALNVPRGRRLDAAQIARAADGGAWATSMTRIPRVPRLKFSSQAEALAALRAHPDGKTLQFREISFNRPGLLPRNNGHPHLHASGTLNELANRCVKGLVDLVTGEAQVTTDVCRWY